MAIEKNKSMNEHVDRMKYLSKYSLNEATYNLVDGIDEDDTLPEEIWSEPTHVKTDMSNSSGMMEDEEPQMDNDGLPVEDPAMGELSPEEMGAEEEMAVEDPMGGEEMDMGMEEPMPEPEPETPSPDQIQNDILKSSISAMQKMNDELNTLESTLGMLNHKIDGLNKEVEEVKEPTNVEKLMSRKEDSHPFYYNLNDMWDGNSFQARREVENSEGMKKTDDGSFVADFDSLPKYTDQEVNDSF
jgi:hypothetical protein